jgi:hypothetical protein
MGLTYIRSLLLISQRYTVLEPVGGAVTQAVTGTSKSAVSRRFITSTAKQARLSARPLDDQRWLIIFLNGFRLEPAPHMLAAGQQPTCALQQRAGRCHSKRIAH